MGGVGGERKRSEGGGEGEREGGREREREREGERERGREREKKKVCIFALIGPRRGLGRLMVGQLQEACAKGFWS